jgi:hypothetical protein
MNTDETQIEKKPSELGLYLCKSVFICGETCRAFLSWRLTQPPYNIGNAETDHYDRSAGQGRL